MGTSSANREAPQAWLQPAGLLLGLLGLVIAAYAYTGNRAYDVKFFWVSLGGLGFIFLGVGLAGWGRVMVARRRPKRARAAKKDAKPPAKAAGAAAKHAEPETPKERRGLLKRKKASAAAALAGWRKPKGKEDAASPFAGWKPRAEEDAPAPVAAPAPSGASGAAEASSAAPADLESLKEAPAPAVPAPPASGLPVRERLTVQCPRCGTEFQVEGTRPIRMTCPKCHLAGTIA